MVICGITVIYLGNKREVPNTILFGLFPIFHGLHEFMEFFHQIQESILLERIETFTAVLGAFSLLAAVIEFNGAIAKPFGKLTSIIGVTTVSYFIFVVPDEAIESLSNTVLNFGLFQSTSFRFFQGFFLSFIAIIATFLTFIYLKWHAKKELISIDPRISRVTALSIIMLTFYAFFEGFNYEIELYNIFRAFSMAFFIIIPLIYLLEMSNTSYFSIMEKIKLERKIKNYKKKQEKLSRNIKMMKLTEKEIRESVENFRTIAEQSFMGIFVIQDENVKYANNTLLQIFEYSYEDVIRWSKKELLQIIHPDDLPILQDYYQKLRIDDPNIQPYYTYRIFTKSKKLKWIDQFSRSIIFKEKPSELVTIMDITEKKEAEQELIKLNNLKSEILRRISHELKTPLVSIKGFSDLLLYAHKEKLDDYVLETINEIKLGCERLESLIHDILKTSELESGAIQLKKTEEDLSFLIKLSVRESQGLAKLRNITINLKIHNNLKVSIEKELIHQVINNLLNNAIKYTPPEGVIEINSEIKNDFIKISIVDTGIGITKGEMEKIFKQFGKIERYGQGLDVISEGSGLGLYISKKILELHSGAIWVESKGRNKGSTFNFTLPVVIKTKINLSINKIQ